MELELIAKQDGTMARIRLRELAENKGLSISRLQIESRLSMGTVRRYWYNTTDGSEHGSRLKMINLDVLDTFARVLNTTPDSLISPDK